MEAAEVKGCPKDGAPCEAAAQGACKCAPKGPTLGEAAAKALRIYGRTGVTAAELAATPNVLAKLEKMARHGAVRVEYSAVREGNTERPGETVARFFP